MEGQRRASTGTGGHRAGYSAKKKPLASVLEQPPARMKDSMEKSPDNTKGGIDLLIMKGMDVEEFTDRTRQQMTKSALQEARRSTPKELAKDKRSPGSNQKLSAPSQSNWGPELKSYQKKRDAIIEIPDEYLDNDIELKKVLDNLSHYQDGFRKIL